MTAIFPPETTQRPELSPAQQRLVEENLHLAKKMARMLRKPICIDWDDWLAEAYLSLAEAVQIYQPEKGDLNAIAYTVAKRRSAKLAFRGIRLWAKNGRFGFPPELEENLAVDPFAEQEGHSEEITRAVLDYLPHKLGKVISLRAKGWAWRAIGQAIGVSEAHAWRLGTRAQRMARERFPDLVA